MAKSPVDNAASNNSRSLVRKSKCFSMRAAETVCFVNCAPINSVSSTSEESELTAAWFSGGYRNIFYASLYSRHL